MVAKLRYEIIETVKPNEILLYGTALPRFKDRHYFEYPVTISKRVVTVESVFPEVITSDVWKIAIRGVLARIKRIVDRPSIWIEIQGTLPINVSSTRLTLQSIKVINDGWSYKAIATIGYVLDAG